MNEFSPVPIKYSKYPDIQIIIPIKNSYDESVKYFKLSLLISDGLIVEQRCKEGGEIEEYHEPQYVPCRMMGDAIEICDPKNCWVPANDRLNAAYANRLADKELVEQPV